MKKDLNIVMNGETLVLDHESMVEVKESNPAEMHTGSVMVAVSMDDLRRLTTIDSRSGRIGYVHVCNEEDCQQVQPEEYKVIDYETNKDCIRIDS
jgi:hypothetical protein